MKRRPPVLLVLLLLVAGAIVNVAVAVGIILCEPTIPFDPDTAFVRLADGSTVNVVRHQTPFTEVIEISRLAGSAQLDAYAHLYHHDPAQLIPAWGSADAPTSQFRMAIRERPEKGIHETRVLIGTGWPLRSWWYVAFHEVATHDPVPTVIHHTSRPFGMASVAMAGFNITRFERALPTDMIGSGFAINTLFYATILWLLVIANPWLRRRQRIKRGLCPKCAYPVGTNERCTECGATHAVKLPPAPSTT